MRVGSIGYDTHSGLGHLLRDFHRNGVVHKVHIIKHREHERHPEWYDKADVYHDPRYLMRNVDILLLFENAFDWQAAALAKRHGVKIVLIPMYEYTPFPVPVTPDLVLCPSLLDYDYYKDRYKCTNITLPVDVPWELREQAFTFVHNAGHGQYLFAKGTKEVVQAWKYVESDARLLVRMQPDDHRTKQLYDELSPLVQNDKRVTIERRQMANEERYPHFGDVYINAEKLNGCSLPLQEAYASGMIVVTSDRYPANTWLPGPLVPVHTYEKHQIRGGSGIEFDLARIEPKDIAVEVDSLYGTEVSHLSTMGRQWAEQNSWTVWRAKFFSMFKELLG